MRPPEGTSERERIAYRLGQLDLVSESQRNESGMVNAVLLGAFESERAGLLSRLAATTPYRQADAERHAERVLFEELIAG